MTTSACASAFSGMQRQQPRIARAGADEPDPARLENRKSFRMPSRSVMPPFYPPWRCRRL